MNIFDLISLWIGRVICTSLLLFLISIPVVRLYYKFFDWFKGARAYMFLRYYISRKEIPTPTLIECYPIFCKNKYTRRYMHLYRLRNIKRLRK